MTWLDVFVHALAIAVMILIYALIFGGAIVALVRILRRMGFSGWWALMIGLWPFGLMLLAWAPWPAFEKKSN